MHEEQQGAVGDPRQAGSEAAVMPFVAVLVGDSLLRLLPVHTEGRIGEAVVEPLEGEFVVAQGVAEVDILGVIPLDHHIRHGDGVGLRVELLAEGDGAGLVGPFVDLLDAGGEETAGAAAGVVDGAYHTLSGQYLLIGGKDQGGGQAHHVAGGEVFACGVVGALGEAPDQLLEDQAHLMVRDGLGVEIDAGELLHHQVEQVGIDQPVEPDGEVEVVEDLPGVFAEPGEVVLQVGAGLGLAQIGQLVAGGVVVAMARYLR